MTPSIKPWFPIRTERLVLRDFRETDFEDVQAYGSDPEVTRYMVWGPNAPDDTRAFLARALAQQTARPRLEFGFAIEHAETGHVIGSAALHLREGPNRPVELGYCLHREWWRQGLVTEAASALIDAGFRTLGLHRIAATCDVRNVGSFGVMEKLGMRREGHLREDRQVKGEWCDSYIYAVLADEWSRR